MNRQTYTELGFLKSVTIGWQKCFGFFFMAAYGVMSATEMSPGGDISSKSKTAALKHRWEPPCFRFYALNPQFSTGGNSFLGDDAISGGMR